MKKGVYLTCFSFFVLLYGCTLQSVVDVPASKKKPTIIIKQADSLRVDLKVDVESESTITIQLNIKNEYSKPFLLYRPLLPDSILREEVFYVLKADSLVNAEYKGFHTFYPQRKERGPGCGPSMGALRKSQLRRRSEFIEINPGQSMSFTCNMTKSFALRSLLHKGENHFFIIYDALMPKVMNGKHVFETDTTDKRSKPVYYFLTSAEKGADEIRQKFTVVCKN